MTTEEKLKLYEAADAANIEYEKCRKEESEASSEFKAAEARYNNALSERRYAERELNKCVERVHEMKRLANEQKQKA